MVVLNPACYVVKDTFRKKSTKNLLKFEKVCCEKASFSNDFFLTKKTEITQSSFLLRYTNHL